MKVDSPTIGVKQPQSSPAGSLLIVDTNLATSCLEIRSLFLLSRSRVEGIVGLGVSDGRVEIVFSFGVLCALITESDHRLGLCRMARDFAYDASQLIRYEGGTQRPLLFQIKPRRQHDLVQSCLRFDPLSQKSPYKTKEYIPTTVTYSMIGRRSAPLRSHPAPCPRSIAVPSQSITSRTTTASGSLQRTTTRGICTRYREVSWRDHGES
ncbi:hypothetical protein [Streptomyces sp. NPDC055189]